MAKTPPDLLQLPQKKQAEYLRSLSRRDLEILWFQMQTYREGFDWLNLAVYSILRDLYESEVQGEAGDKEQPLGPDIRGVSKLDGRGSNFSDRGK